MSIKIMSRVWDETPFDKTTLLVMLCLADHADDEGRCWPSVPRLAERARCSERWCRDVLSQLADQGWLERDLRPGKSTMYRIVFPDKVTPTPEVGITPEDTSPLNPGSGVPRKWGSGHPGSGAPMNHQEPSFESSDVVGSVPEVPHQREVHHHGDDPVLAEAVTESEPDASSRLKSLKDSNQWTPSDAALKTARAQVRLVDIPIHIVRYAIVKREKGAADSMTSSEWLRWILADEAKALADQRLMERNDRNTGAWYQVAD